ncbi:hypothetical protein V8J88_07275 [Massilia sp. W12]|uniref:hypothetical protein n=1 Tax=Massilia sp. W12 TaxID=3126507 RepID=UPI0030CDED8A
MHTWYQYYKLEASQLERAQLGFAQMRAHLAKLGFYGELQLKQDAAEQLTLLEVWRMLDVCKLDPGHVPELLQVSAAASGLDLFGVRHIEHFVSLECAPCV